VRPYSPDPQRAVVRYSARCRRYGIWTAVLLVPLLPGLTGVGPAETSRSDLPIVVSVGLSLFLLTLPGRRHALAWIQGDSSAQANLTDREAAQIWVASGQLALCGSRLLVRSTTTGIALVAVVCCIFVRSGHLDTGGRLLPPLAVLANALALTYAFTLLLVSTQFRLAERKQKRAILIQVSPLHPFQQPPLLSVAQDTPLSWKEAMATLRANSPGPTLPIPGPAEVAAAAAVLNRMSEGTPSSRSARNNNLNRHEEWGAP
jgi:hypothetical protein